MQGKQLTLVQSPQLWSQILSWNIHFLEVGYFLPREGVCPLPSLLFCLYLLPMNTPFLLRMREQLMKSCTDLSSFSFWGDWIDSGTTRLYTQESLMTVCRGPYEMLGLNPGQPYARQELYSLCYYSSPELIYFLH